MQDTYQGARYFDNENFPEYSLIFELRSFIGRLLFSRKPPFKNGILNFGCADHYDLADCNADFFVFSYTRRLLRRPLVGRDWQLDARWPLKCDDNFFEGIFCEHVLEHIKIADNRRLLKEFLRILQPGRLIRLTVPSMEKYIAYYKGEYTHPGFAIWGSPGEALWAVNHNWGHQCCFDFVFLKQLLEEAGFEGVVRRDFHQGADARLQRDNPERAWETLYVEARKPV